MRKYIVVLLILLTQVSVTKAQELSCAERLNRLALGALINGEPCENCGRSLLEAVRSGPAVVTLMANWVSRGAMSIQDLNSIQDEAKKAGVEILNSMSSQLAFPGFPTGSNLLTTLVFRGDKAKVADLFGRVGSQVAGLANFEILNADQIPVALTSIDTSNPKETELVLNNSLKESASKIILINDSQTNSFVVLVGEGVARDYSRLGSLKDDDGALLKMSVRTLATTWKPGRKGLRGAEKFIKLINPNTDLAGYLMSLDDLSKLQSERVSFFNKMGQQQDSVPPVAGAPKKSKVTPATAKALSGANSRVLTISGTDFVSRRGLVFAKKKFSLSSETPTFRISLWNSPYFIVFYPKYFDEKSEREILSAYRRLAEMGPNEEIPKTILAFIHSYKSGRARVNTFLDYSLSDFKTATSYKILAKSHDSEKPIVATQLKSKGNDDEMVLIPVIRK